ncbi:cobalt-precorrin 5A hydrolase [Clostridium sp. D2Q-14]|uniref:cobalt-precorrin 5A hydrolase n=1 Tax=Anaeromonas gelatinilytica TaxID=2683194 RepID=UPI00193BEF7E|nr:cobalt-precorrin 5A hydrolase [Anaeromonas gelatinilytica]MBS4535484.1 cobalt-precorrin 5A hydrolase [Anaeromonas gelatinilytica]
MKLAIVTLTDGGMVTAEKVAKNMNFSVNVYGKGSFTGSLKDFVGKLFDEYRHILFIMATGIVVRVISPYIKDKTVDPGVMVMDEKGEFVISLLSGHLGGANEYTKKIAENIDAIPVITTASDVLHRISVDMLAKELNCKMESFIKAKEITSDIVNGKRVGIFTDIAINISEDNHIKIITEDSIEDYDSIIYITNKVRDDFHPRSIQLIPRNIVVGVGCRRGVSSRKIINGINIMFEELKIKVGSIKKLSSVDIKKDEIGILETAEHFKVPVDFIGREEIRDVENKFKGSEFVRKAIGVGAVAEPCGYISSNSGGCLMNKRKLDGFTLSVWEEKHDE